MKLKEVEAEEMFTFSEVLKKVDLSESALRKYVSLIDNQTPGGKHFYRNKQNHRLYSVDDIELLQEIILLKSSDIKLENAIEQSLFKKGYNSITAESTEESVSNVTLNAIISVVHKQAEIMEKQSANIDRLESILEKMLSVEEERKLIDSEQKKEEIPSSENKKTSFFKKIFR